MIIQAFITMIQALGEGRIRLTTDKGKEIYGTENGEYDKDFSYFTPCDGPIYMWI